MPSLEGLVGACQTDTQPLHRSGLLPEVCPASAIAFIFVGDGQPGRVTTSRDAQGPILSCSSRVFLPPGRAHGHRHRLPHFCHGCHRGAGHANLLRGSPGEGSRWTEGNLGEGGERVMGIEWLRWWEAARKWEGKRKEMAQDDQEDRKRGSRLMEVLEGGGGHHPTSPLFSCS